MESLPLRGYVKSEKNGIQSFSFRDFLESKALALGIFWNPKL
jgi:hypothetical protein